MIFKKVIHIRTYSQFPPSLSNVSLESFNQKLSVWMVKYEDFVGLTEVKAAQNRVLEAETRFIKAQEERREAQRQIGAIQHKLHELHAELDRIPKGDDKFLTLITQEHTIIKDERRLQDEFKQFEKEERENFATLSHTVRDSHEKERAQAEKTKYWSIIGSVLGTMIGIFGTSINNHMRMKELRNLVEQTALKNEVNIDIEELKKQVLTVIKQSVAEDSTQSLTNSLKHEYSSEDVISQVQVLFDGMMKTIKQNHDVNLQQHQRIEALLLTRSDHVYKDLPIQFVFSEKELKVMLTNQTKDFGHLIMISSILIPICTWALVKFVNF